MDARSDQADEYAFQRDLLCHANPSNSSFVRNENDPGIATTAVEPVLADEQDVVITDEVLTPVIDSDRHSSDLDSHDSSKITGNIQAFETSHILLFV